MWTLDHNAIEIQPEPLPTIAPDDGLLVLQQVMTMTTLSRTVIYREMRKGTFPHPITVGAGSSRWLRSEVMQYLLRRVVERNAQKK